MKIELQYFKPTGKYYSSGDLYVPDNYAMYQVSEKVKALQKYKLLPDLVEGHSDFHVLITGKGHPHGFPILIINEEYASN